MLHRAADRVCANVAAYAHASMELFALPCWSEQGLLGNAGEMVLEPPLPGAGGVHAAVAQAAWTGV